MKLSEVKNTLAGLKELKFLLPDGTLVPAHFHITEIGEVTKHFIDCGGNVRRTKTIHFQLWEAGDFDHRLAPQKLSSIISLAEKTLQLGDSEVEVEYQSDTIGIYDLGFDKADFILISKSTNCLANEACGTSMANSGNFVSELQVKNSCAPGGGCC